MDTNGVVTFARSRSSLYFGLIVAVVVPLALLRPIWMGLRLAWRMLTMPGSHGPAAIIPFAVAAFLTCVCGVVLRIVYGNWRDRDRPLIRLAPEGITVLQRPPVTIAWPDIAAAQIELRNRTVSLCPTMDSPASGQRFNLALLATHPRDLLAAIEAYPAYRNTPDGVYEKFARHAPLLKFG